MDLVRVQDVGLRTRSDCDVLDWAASEQRVILTHDCSTLVAEAWRYVQLGQPMAGVFAMPQQAATATAIEDILLLAECSQTHEWANQVRYLPFDRSS